MLRYLYDGTLHGLYSAIRCVLYDKAGNATISAATEYQPGLFDTISTVATDVDDKNRIDDFLMQYCGAATFETWCYSICSGNSDRNRICCNYLQAAVEYRNRVDRMVHDPRVIECHQCSSQVLREIHRMVGILRFEELQDGLSYGRCEPDHDIIGFLALHFMQRLPDQPWAIHDLRRARAILYDKQHLEYVHVPVLYEPSRSRQEHFIGGLWRNYHNRMCIAERKNLQLQQHFIPNRYRPYMTEFALRSSEADILNYKQYTGDHAARG
ncbi:MAG: TIGR03915 family putative DNA repair protein [Chitinivibrionales bacterium]|nr:TIGR03915 family putative DNA repair protein [Chitinivibrionales bacterium]